MLRLCPRIPNPNHVTRSALYSVECELTRRRTTAFNIEHRWRADTSIRYRHDKDAHFVDESGSKHPSIDSPAAFEHQRADAEARADLLQCEREINIVLPGQHKRDTALAQEREILVRDTLAEDNDNVVAVDVVAFPCESATRVDGDRER